MSCPSERLSFSPTPSRLVLAPAAPPCSLQHRRTLQSNAAPPGVTCDHPQAATTVTEGSGAPAAPTMAIFGRSDAQDPQLPYSEFVSYRL